jgi:predicted small secreted protein
MPRFNSHSTSFDRGVAMFNKFVMMLFALALGSSALTGCNTIRGAGTDIKKAGSEITEEAQEHRKY